MAGFKLILLLVIFTSYAASAQESQYFVFFKDKANTPFSLSSPSQFLSERSIARRQKQGIEITEEDLPVNPAYVSQVIAAGATAFYTSRWWNGALIEATGTALTTIISLPFVSHYMMVAPGKKITGGRIRNNKHRKSTSADEPVNQVQLAQIGLDDMHTMGYSGEGIRVAIFDSGFVGVNQTEPFALLFTEGRVKQTYNFVNNNTEVYQNHSHGTEVLSVMAANTPGVFTGGVHKAEYLLYITEDVSSEYRVEEFNWTIAAERADSAGADVINSSLGYYDFDDPAMNYTKADLDGKTAVITQAARKAINKGIVIVTSAGNEGGNSWKLVTPPADAEEILAAGSVNSQGELSGFSSVGPTDDNRIKPDVVAMGAGTSVIRANGSLGNASGTSLASPLIASLAAGVLQAFPALTAQEVYEAIVNSADQASRPDNQMGYGLPHFMAVKNYIEGKQSEEIVSVYPNPVTGNSFRIKLKTLTEAPLQIVIFDSQGKRAEEYNNSITWLNNPLEYDLSNLQAGLYLIRITAGTQITTLKFVKL
jgi:subtilisin family serine protease